MFNLVQEMEGHLSNFEDNWKGLFQIYTKEREEMVATLSVGLDVGCSTLLASVGGDVEHL